MLRQRRRALSRSQQRIAARNLYRQLVQSPAFRRARHIALYLPNDGEIDPRPLLAAAQSKATRSALGLNLQALTPRIAEQLGVPASTRGVVIASVDSSSDAAANGLKRGDVILSINQQPVTTVAAVAQILAEAKKSGRNTALLQVQRGQQPPLYLGVKLDQANQH